MGFLCTYERNDCEKIVIDMLKTVNYNIVYRNSLKRGIVCLLVESKN